MPTRRVGLPGCCVVLLVLRAPRVLSGGPVCLVCAWAAVFLLVVCCPTDLRPPRGLPARFGRPRRELRSARRLVVRPGPAAHRHRGSALWRPPAPFTPVVLGVLACGWVRRLVVGPGPANSRGHRSQAPLWPTGPAAALAHIAAELLNFACNSPTTLSNHEFTTLELQRFQTLLKLHPIELHAKFGEGCVVGVRWGVGA